MNLPMSIPRNTFIFDDIADHVGLGFKNMHVTKYEYCRLITARVIQLIKSNSYCKPDYIRKAIDDINSGNHDLCIIRNHGVKLTAKEMIITKRLRESCV